MILYVDDTCAYVKLIDTHINVAMRIITRTVYSTSIPWIYVLINAPMAILRKQSIRECVKIRDNPNLPITDDLQSARIKSRLKSRKLFWNFYWKFGTLEFLRRLWSRLNPIRTGHGWINGISLHNRMWKRAPTLIRRSRYGSDS